MRGQILPLKCKVYTNRILPAQAVILFVAAMCELVFQRLSHKKACFCFIHSEIQNAQPKPRDCELDWQATFVLPAKGKPEVVWECAGDTPYGTPQTLPYGNSIKGKGWECSSNMSGMLCTNQSGNGFKLNRQEQTLF